MNALTLAEEIINGRRITREDDLSFFLTCDLGELCEGADKIREARIGDKVDLCSIINGRSGRCPEDCKYCAQSAHHHTNCEEYDFLPEEDILAACKMNEREGVDRFSIVTAGRALTGEEFDKAIHAYETMKKECKIDLCASMGFLSAEQLYRLHEAGVTSYHHNIETSRRNFPNICTTHTYDMNIEKSKGRGNVRLLRRNHRHGRNVGGQTGYGGQSCRAWNRLDSDQCADADTGNTVRRSAKTV